MLGRSLDWEKNSFAFDTSCFLTWRVDKVANSLLDSGAPPQLHATIHKRR